MMLSYDCGVPSRAREEPRLPVRVPTPPSEIGASPARPEMPPAPLLK
jgi:hypothetical protein